LIYYRRHKDARRCRISHFIFAMRCALFLRRQRRLRRHTTHYARYADMGR
jgi:hypothetical protein